MLNDMAGRLGVHFPSGLFDDIFHVPSPIDRPGRDLISGVPEFSCSKNDVAERDVIEEEQTILQDRVARCHFQSLSVGNGAIGRETIERVMHEIGIRISNAGDAGGGQCGVGTGLGNVVG
jgi:hypothetical protein